MAGLTPLPQTVLHTSTRLTHSQAHNHLSSFLQEAETNPAYRPDASLTPQGVTASSVGADSSLTLNHLKRILHGIEGKKVGGVEFNYGQGPPREHKRRRVDGEGQGQGQGFASSPPVVLGGQLEGAEGVVAVEGEDGGDVAAVVGREMGDWQDKEDYEHAQVDETEDLEGRDPADPDEEGDGDGAHMNRGVDRGIEVTGGQGQGRGLTQAEREARKLEKQARRKKEKVERNTQQQQGKERKNKTKG